MSFITIAEVRTRSGAPDTLISDADIQTFIDQVEEEMARWMNTRFEPTETIEIRDGNGMSTMFLRKNPVLSVRQLTVNDTTAVTPSTLNWHKDSGKVSLTASAEGGTFVWKEQNTFIKYLYGMLVESQTSTLKTTSTANVAVGTDVSISVTAIGTFAQNDWVEIYGMDGKREVAQINAAPSGTTIQVDQLVQSHASGSVVVKLVIPEYIRTYMMIEAAICVGINAIGATYTFSAGYSLGELQVTKGVPYTHWRESVSNLLKERNMRKSRIRPRTAIMVN